MTIDFSELTELLGQRIDSDAVVRFVAPWGRVLKPTTDNAAQGYVGDKKSGLGIGWSHEVRLPDYFPPRRENRRYVCFVSSVSFDPARVSGLPLRLGTTTTVQELADLLGVAHAGLLGGNIDLAVPGHPDHAVRLGMGKDGRLADRWEVRLAAHQRYATLGSRGHAFAPWRTEWPIEQADLVAGFFVAWCIRRGLIGERHLAERPALVAAVTEGRMTGRSFLYEAAYAGELWSWDVSTDLQDFSHRYFSGLCHRNSSDPVLGAAGECHPDYDFAGIFDSYFPGRSLDAADDENNFRRFALFLDARWDDYRLTGFRDEISDEEARDVSHVYRRQQALMAALPAPRSIDVGASLGEAAEGSELVSLFGRALNDPSVIAVVTRALGAEALKRRWDRAVEMPGHGLVLELGYPWELRRLEPEYDSAARQAYRRKSRWMVTGAVFAQEGYSRFSFTEAAGLHYSAYPGRLPFGLTLDDTVEELDRRFGSDAFAKDFGEDGALTRRWEISNAGEPLGGEADGSHLVLLVYFAQRVIRNVTLVYR